MGAVLAALLLPATALAADPEPSDSSSPESSPSASVEAEATDSPTDPPTPSPEATAENTPSPQEEPTPVATDAPPTEPPATDPTDPPAATPIATPRTPESPPPAAHTTTTGSGGAPVTTMSVTVSGYRYTTTDTALYADRAASSTVLLPLAANAQVAVTGSQTQAGEEWVTASREAVTGYVPGELLATTSAPTPLSVVRRMNVPSALRTSMSSAAAVVVSLAPGAYVTTESTALDSFGATWVLARRATATATYRGYTLWTDTTAPRVSATGTWTVVRSTNLNRYALSGTALRTLAAGAQVKRYWSVSDTGGISWTYATAGSSSGWVLSGYLTPPFKQFIWNRKNPVTQQYTNYWCVPASVQTELNIGLDAYSTSYWFQKKAYIYGRANLGYQITGVGLDPQAWERSLSYFDHMFGSRPVDYVDATYSSYGAAIKAGALQMRRTKLPVGLLVYYGGHAWTMIGFTATADPLKTSAFRVTGIYVAAPFVRWTDPRAGTYYTTSQFARKMTPYIEPTRWTRWNGLYTIVLPTG